MNTRFVALLCAVVIALSSAGAAYAEADETESGGFLSDVTSRLGGTGDDALGDIKGSVEGAVTDNINYVKEKIDSIERKIATLVFSFTTAQILISLGNMVLTALLTSFFISRRISTKQIEDAVGRVVAKGGG